MSEQEIFEFLKRNLTLSEDQHYANGDFYDSNYVKIELLLKNPETGKPEVIGQVSFTLPG